MKTVEQLLILGRKINESIESMASCGVYSEHTLSTETGIIYIVFDILEIDHESIAPLAQAICQCVAREISVEELMERIRAPVRGE